MFIPFRKEPTPTLSTRTAKKILKNIGTSMVRNSKTNRIVKNIDLTVDEIIEIYNRQDGKCYWSGFQMHEMYNDISRHPLAISPDRLDNDKDYVKDNLVLCHRMFNLGRSTMDSDSFSLLMKNLESGYRQKYRVQYIVYGLMAGIAGTLPVLFFIG